jgi:hypothetical protein
MGIALTILAATDAQIRAFQADPVPIDAIVAGHGSSVCDLWDYWDGLHYLLTGGHAAGSLPLGALKIGTTTIAGASDPTHALHAAMTAALAEALRPLGSVDLLRRFDPPAMMRAGDRGKPIYPGRYWTPHVPRERVAAELWEVFDRYRAFVVRAAAEGEGLVVCRYEDW